MVTCRSPGGQRVSGLLELELQVVCEPPDMDAETLTWVLSKNSKGPPAYGMQI